MVCDAIDALCPLLEYLEDDIITKYFLPQLLSFLDFKNHTTEEITGEFCKNFGPVVFNLSKKKLHIIQKQEYINFWKDMLTHEDVKIKCVGIYILPCMF